MSAIKIGLLVEGKTEKVFLEPLRNHLRKELQGSMPKLTTLNKNGLVPRGDALANIVQQLLSECDYVIVLTDVYTGQRSFKDADDAKKQLTQESGNHQRCFVHAAQYEFEAWLLPYWSRVQQIARTKKAVPGKHPEKVNHDRPPSVHLSEAFKSSPTGCFVKVRDAARIIRDQDLQIAIDACPELKAFVDRIKELAVTPPESQ